MFWYLKILYFCASSLQVNYSTWIDVDAYDKGMETFHPLKSNASIMLSHLRGVWRLREFGFQSIVFPSVLQIENNKEVVFVATLEMFRSDFQLSTDNCKGKPNQSYHPQGLWKLDNRRLSGVFAKERTAKPLLQGIKLY